MRIKLGENLPSDIAVLLRLMGHDADTVIEENLAAAVDERIWSAAQTEKRFLITQDLDFSDIRRFRPGTHEGLLILRLRRGSRLNLIARVRTLFETEAVEQWTGCVVVATDLKLRVRRPVPTARDGG